jgi:hypothetical protein
MAITAPEQSPLRTGPSSVMPPGGGVEWNGKWYTLASWHALQASGQGPQGSQGAAGGGGPATAGLSAKAIITNLLAPLGLEGLADWAWNAYNTSGGSLDYVNAQLPQQKAFQERFPEYAALAATGDAMTPAQIVAAEKQVGEMFTQYGLTGMAGYDPRTATAALLDGHVSMSELDARLQARQAAAAQYHPDVHAQLAMLGVPDTNAALTAYVTDPKTALPVLQQQILAAQDAAKAANTGFGQLTADQATHLAQLGVTPDQAQQGFGQLGVLGQLRSALPGESGTGVSASQMMGAQFDQNATDIQALLSEQQRRQAQFQNKGQYAGSQAGLTGVGPANPI